MNSFPMRQAASGALLLWLALAGRVQSAEVIPPAPTRYFNDYAQTVSPATADRLNRTLEDFEKATSSQVVVAIYPRMQSESAMEDYTVRVYQAWKVGQKGKDNGAVLFVFVQDRRMRIEVGYGLEGALPDALAKRIIEDEIKPFFQRNDFDGGLTAGVTAILQAARGEYQGTGRTVTQGRQPTSTGRPFPVIFIVLFFVVVAILNALGRRRGVVYHRRGRTSWGGGWGGGGWSGGGGGFSGGGFSGGGGRSGGGGASGSW